MKWKLSYQDQWTETEMTDLAIQQMLAQRGAGGLGFFVILADDEAIESLKRDRMAQLHRSPSSLRIVPEEAHGVPIKRLTENGH